MKKLGLGLIGIILAAGLYYFTAGSEKLTEEMKVRVNTELTMIEQNGFAIEERKVEAKKEHFVLSFDNPEKVMKFFKKQGSDVTLEEVKSLSGMKLGVDLSYLKDGYSALSADIYPLTLPDVITTVPDMNDEDKAFIAHMNEMLKRKVFLVHVDFNKLLSSFKGFIKDIDESYMAKKEVKFTLKGATFSGEIAEDRIHKLAQELKTLTLALGDDFTFKIAGQKSDYQLKGKTLYDSVYNYSLENIEVSGKQNLETFSVTAKKIQGDNETSVLNDLASNKINVNVEDITIEENKEHNQLKNMHFSFNIGNLDMNVLKKIEDTDINDEAAINQLIQELISKGITMDIPNFEVKKLEYAGKEIDGFTLTSSFKINASANFAAIQANPLAALSAINTKTKLVLSDALFKLMAQQPKMMMLAMVIQPKVVNGKKVYEIELKEGKLIVNGSPVM